MDTFERIPVDLRWKLAAQEFTALPFSYRRVIEGGAGDRLYDEVEREIWQEMGREAGIIARAFGMPLRNAREVAEAFAASAKIFFGAGWHYDIRSSALDEVELTIRRCALVDKAEEMGEKPLSACNICHAFSNGVVPDLNPNYIPKYRSGICAGDSECLIVIQSRGQE